MIRPRLKIGIIGIICLIGLFIYFFVLSFYRPTDILYSDGSIYSGAETTNFKTQDEEPTIIICEHPGGVNKTEFNLASNIPYIIPWGSDIFIDIDVEQYFSSQYSAIRTLVNSNGAVLKLPERVAVEWVDVDTVKISHSPWGAVWFNGGDFEEVFVRYQLVTPNGPSEEYHFTLKSDFPTLLNSNLHEILNNSVEQNEIFRELLTVGDTNGDGETENISLQITNDGIPFISIEGEIVACLSRHEPSFYELSQLQAIDLNGDSYDEIVCFWNTSDMFRMQCIAYIDGKWEELFLPKIEFNIVLANNFCVQLLLPNGEMWKINAADFPSLKACFDDDGDPYSVKAEIVCIQDALYYKTIFRNEQKQIELLGVFDILATTDMLGELVEEQWTFMTMPIYITLMGSQLLFEYGSPTVVV